MDILVISPTPSHPTTAGNRARIRSMLQSLREMGHYIHFCYVGREGANSDSIAEMKKTWDEFTFIPYDRSRERKPLSHDVFAIDDWIQPNFRAFLEYYSSVKQPDMVLVEYVFFSYALTWFPDSFRVIDCHDIFTDRHLKLDALSLPRSFFYTTEAEEKKGFSRANLVIAIQNNEAEILRRMTKTGVCTIGYLPVGFELNKIKAVKPQNRDRIIGYIGGVNPINIISLQMFIESISFEKIMSSGWRFVIAGTICNVIPENLRRFSVKNGVEFLGDLDNPLDFLETCHIVVNPHMGGTGLKIKTIDAMAAGCCVIGTKDAFLGIPTASFWHQFPDASTLADNLPEILKDKSKLEVATKDTEVAWSEYRNKYVSSISVFTGVNSLDSHTITSSLLVVTDIRFWKEGLGNETRLAHLLRSLPPAIRATIFFLGSISPQDRIVINQLNICANVVSHREYLDGFDGGTVLRPENENRMNGFEKKYFARIFFYSLERFLENNKFDMVMIEYIRLSYLILSNNIPNIKIIDTHDIMSMRNYNFNFFGKKHFIDISSSDEFDILDRFDYVGCIQCHEFSLVESVLPGKAIFMPHVVSLPKVVPSFSRGPLIIGFIGGNSPMNIDGIKWFLEQVWPIFSDTGIQLHIAGYVCDALRDNVDIMHENVHLLGKVDDIQDFYENLYMAINPVYYGGGIKIKSIEAMSYGIPLIATPEAAFGLEKGAGESFLMPRTRKQFAEAILLLLTDKRLHKEIGAAGRALIAEVASPRYIYDSFNHLAQAFGAIRAHDNARRNA